MSPARPLLILGAGGHARVVVDILRAGSAPLLGLLDRDAKLHNTEVDGVPVLGGDDVVAKHASGDVLLVNALGNVARQGDGGLKARRALFEAFKAKGYTFAQVISPAAVVSPRATLGEGCHIITRAVVHPGAVIGDNAIVNTGAQVDHDCRIGAHAHIAPGAVLCGNVTVDEGSHIGAGAVIIENIKVGAGAVVAAGAVIVKDVAAEATAF